MTTKLPRMTVLEYCDGATRDDFEGDIFNISDLLKHYNVPPIDRLAYIWVELSNRQFPDRQGVAFKFRFWKGIYGWPDDLDIRLALHNIECTWEPFGCYDKRLKRLGVCSGKWTKLYVALWYEENE